MDAQERFEYLSPVMQVVLMEATFRPNARDYDTAYQELYERFKEKCLYLQAHVHHGFLAYASVAQTLAWLCISSDENHMRHAL